MIDWLVGRLGDTGRVILLLWLLIAIGLLSLVVPACVQLTHGNWAGALTVIGSGLFLAGASTLVGSAVGFLFGVPVREQEPETDNTGTAKKSIGYQPNTNLELISDWLTKIIVGIGLVQFPKISHFFVLLGHYAGPAFGSAPAGEIIAVSIAIHYTLVGFFNGFLLAYLWLPGAFKRAMEEKGASAIKAPRGNAEQGSGNSSQIGLEVSNVTAVGGTRTPRLIYGSGYLVEGRLSLAVWWAGDPRPSAFQARTYPQLMQIARELCAVTSR